MPAIVASLLLVFTISFDNITASMFWRPPGVETMPTQILSMLKISISPEINALGTLMIIVTVGLPLLGGELARLLGRERVDPFKEENMKHITDTRLAALRERHGNGDLDRRTFLGLAAALAARPASSPLDRPGSGCRHRGPFRRLGRRRQGGDRQIRLPALHQEERGEGGSRGPSAMRARSSPR